MNHRVNTSGVVELRRTNEYAIAIDILRVLLNTDLNRLGVPGPLTAELIFLEKLLAAMLVAPLPSLLKFSLAFPAETLAVQDFRQHTGKGKTQEFLQGTGQADLVATL